MSKQSIAGEEMFSEKELPTVSQEETAEFAAGTEAGKSVRKKKRLLLIAAALVVLIIATVILFIPSKFSRVKDECGHIIGWIQGGRDYFIIDTLPELYDGMDESYDSLKAVLISSTQDKALEAIKYANAELGFNGSVYSQMMKTTALMGRQSAENAKYRISWTYHPDDGLEVTYEKK